MSRLYIAGKPGIQAYSMDGNTGALTPVGKLHEPDGAGSYVAGSPDGRFLYSCSSAGGAAFAIDQSTGDLTHINTVKHDYPGNAHVDVSYHGGHGMAIFSAYVGGGLNVVKMRSDGGLEALPGASVKHEGGSGVFAEGVQSESHAHSCFVDYTGKWGLVSDLGQDKVYVYKVDARAGTFTMDHIVETAPGAGPRHLCFHPRGPFVYGINELDCTVAVYSYKDGELGKELQKVSTLPEGYDNHNHSDAKNADGKAASGPNREGGQTNACADIHITPDSRFLYASNRGHDSLVCFSVGRDGLLKLKDFTYTKGEHPRSFGIHPSGRFILVANQDSNNVVVFKLDKKTGELTPTGDEVTLNKARCVMWVTEPPRLRKPSWTKISKLNPDARGINVFAKVVKIVDVEGREFKEVVIGDETGLVTLTAEGDQLSICQVGAMIRIQNAFIRMEKGHMRVQANKWGVVRPAPDQEDIEPNMSKDLSATEYELS